MTSFVITNGFAMLILSCLLCVAPSSSFSHPNNKRIIKSNQLKSSPFFQINKRKTCSLFPLHGWTQGGDGEWIWEEDDPNSASATVTATINEGDGKITAQATPSLPGGKFRPKQSLGQNYLRDGNTVAKMVKAFAKDAVETLSKSSKKEGTIGKIDLNDLKQQTGLRAVELGPGAGALTDVIINAIGCSNFQCIEIDGRAVELLSEKHPNLRINHEDVLQVDYPLLAEEEGGPLSVIGNLPYYITSQILFALADASHSNSIRSATVTMQWEVAQRIVAPTRCKDYGILSVVFQLYADCKIHFKIPPTVFYPQPKVDSALIGLHFIGPTALKRRLAGVSPSNLRTVVTATFQQRRKTVRNGLKNLALAKFGGDKEKVFKFFESAPLPLPDVVREAQEAGDEFALSQELPENWSSKRPEELSSGQFVEITRLLFGSEDGYDAADWQSMKLDNKVWRKLKHGAN